MTAGRVDEASCIVAAPPAAVYRAFAEAAAMEAWLPPAGMTGRMLAFEFREGGGYRMRLAYGDAQRGRGKTTDDADVVDVRFVRLDADRGIEQAVVFDSADASYGGVMTMTWSFRPARDLAGGAVHDLADTASDAAEVAVPAATEVTLRATNVPPGISAADHAAGLASTLANLARYVEAGAGRP